MPECSLPACVGRGGRSKKVVIHKPGREASSEGSADGTLILDSTLLNWGNQSVS